MPLSDIKRTVPDNEAKDLINHIAVAMKTAQIHQLDNVAVTNVIKKLLAILNPLISSGTVTLELVGEFFHLNSDRVRYSMEHIINFDFLIKEFRKRELGAIVFKDTLHENDVKALLTAITTSGFSDTPFETLFEALENVPQIEMEKLRKIKEYNGEFDRKQIVKKTYFNAVSITKGTLKKIKEGEKINLKKTKRVVETIVDQIIEEKSLLFGMTTVKDYDEYTYNHSVNVSILAIALGHRIGLAKKKLTELGLSALLHDIGKIEIPVEILNKTTEFTDEDWKVMVQHPIWGASAIFKLKGIDRSSMGAVIAAFEHHLNYDLSGYPKLKNRISLDLFSKIIAIVDQYDAMTSSRVYSRIPIPPDKALHIMIERSGIQLDPYLLKIFINMVGVYPVGSLVMLDTNELGLVFESNTNSDFTNRPRVLVIVDNSGARVKNVVDLMKKDKNGNYRRSIVKSLDPNQYKINLAEYLF